MKYILFGLSLFIGVPVMAGLAGRSRFARRFLIAALLFSPILGSKASLNVYSMEEYRGPDRGFEITLTDLIGLGLMGSMVLGAGRPRHLLPKGLGVLLLYDLVAFVSWTQSAVPVQSAFTLFKLVRMTVLFWTIVNVLDRDPDLAPIRWAWTAIAVSMTVLVLYQKYRLGIYRVPGPFDHSNTIPLYVNLILPILLVWTLSDPSISSIGVVGSMGCVLGLLFAVVATFSRAGMALAGSAIVASILWVNVRQRSGRSIGTALVIGFCMLLGSIKVAGSVIRRFQNAPKASEEARHEFNHAARLMAADRVLGVGINAFSHEMTNRQKYREHLTTMANEEHAGVAHHIYLLTAAELGYVGLAVFVMMIGRFQWLALRTALGPPGLPVLLNGGAFVGMGCLHVSGFLEWALRISPVSYQYTMICALVVVFFERARRDQSLAKRPVAPTKSPST